MYRRHRSQHSITPPSAAATSRMLRKRYGFSLCRLAGVPLCVCASDCHAAGTKPDQHRNHTHQMTKIITKSAAFVASIVLAAGAVHAEDSALLDLLQKKGILTPK